MTDRELKSELDRLGRKRDLEIKEAKERYDKGRKAALDRFARENARFGKGDYIMCPPKGEPGMGCGYRGRAYTRVERIRTELDYQGKPVVVYSGPHLLPDLTVWERSSSPEFIYDTGADDVIRLDKPEFTEFVLVGASGKYPDQRTKSYHEAVELRSYFFSRKEDSRTYGVREDGSRVELHYQPYFELPRIPHHW